MATRRKLTAEIWHKGLILPWQNLHNQRFCYTFATEINCQDKYIMNENLNPAKRKAMAVKNEKRFLKQKRNALKNPGYSHHPVKTQASFKRLLKAV